MDKVFFELNMCVPVYDPLILYVRSLTHIEGKGDVCPHLIEVDSNIIEGDTFNLGRTYNKYKYIKSNIRHSYLECEKIIHLK